VCEAVDRSPLFIGTGRFALAFRSSHVPEPWRTAARCDLRDERFGGEPIDVSFVGTLRLDQEAAIASMLRHDAGVLCAPTAFGKTVTAAALIARRGVNTLVLVHRTELLKQWQERLQAFLGVGKGVVGTIGGGKAKPTGKIDIAVMQSLSRQGEVNPLVEGDGQVIVDECLHVGAVSFDAILKRTKARFVLGLTATPIRRDGQQPIIFMQCGPIRHTAAKPAGVPRDLEVVPHTRHARIDVAADAGIQDVFRYLANDAAQTAAIAAEVRSAVGQGRKVLVLAMPVSLKGTRQQYAGRLHREHVSKTDVRIIDCVDTGHPAARRCCGCGTSGNVAPERWGTGLVLIHILPSNHKKTILSLVQVRSPAMRYSSQVKPISYLKANAAEVLTHLAEQRAPMVITQNGEAKAVLQDVASFEETQETLALLKILALGNQDLAAGKVKPVADVVARLRAKRAVV